MKTDTIAAKIVNQISDRAQENFDLFSDYINPSFVKLLGMIGFGQRYSKSCGLELIDTKGQRYLDFVSGYGVHNIGHNHPEVKEAIKAVIDMDVPGFSQVECGLLPALAAEKLASLLPEDLNKVYFCSSGNEAVDAALKLARGATNRKKFICCDGGFHGNSLGVLGLTDNPDRRDRFRPLIPGVVHVPLGDLDALEKALRWKDVAAMIVEPVLGEGGAIVPEHNYLPAALELCHRYGTLFIVDEVQTGLGRTGSMFAIENTGIVPDAIALSKALSGGLIPVGAMVARGPLFKKAYGNIKNCIDHKTTFSGGPIAMTAVLATLDVIKEEKLIENCKEQGLYLKKKLTELCDRYDQIAEIRGVGLLLGIKFNKVSTPGLKEILPNGVHKAAAELFTQYTALQLLKEHKIVTQVGANDFSVLKVMPPLSIDKKSIDHFINSLDEILSDSGYVSAAMSLAKEIWKNR